MVLDYKKEYKEFYMPKNKPEIVTVLQINYIAVRGRGRPNEENGEYRESIGLLYGIAFTIIKQKTDYRIKGYFDYVVPPAEGFWKQEGSAEFDCNKSKLSFISVICVADFVTKEDFDWAVSEAS